MSEDLKTLIIHVEELGWLLPDGSYGPEEHDAARFKFRASPTGVDQRRIESAIQDFCAEVDSTADKLGAWQDRHMAMEKARLAAWNRLSKILKVEATPKKEGESDDDHKKRKDELIVDAWSESKDPDFLKSRARWNYFRDMLDEFELWAKWKVMQADVPLGWELIQNRADYTELRRVMAKAWANLYKKQAKGK